MCPRARITERRQTWRTHCWRTCQEVAGAAGRKLTVRYTGIRHNIPRYSCWRGLLVQWRAAVYRFRGARASTMQSRKRSCVSSNRGQSRPPPRPRRKAADRRVPDPEMRSAADLEAARYAGRPGLPAVRFYRSVRTGWSAANWSCDGTAPSRNVAAWRARSPRR